MHGADGFAGSFEESDHFAFGELGAVDQVGVYSVLEVSALSQWERYLYLVVLQFE